mmetsp:Transcript_70212/g.195998  ORF Transcript_70212/g.195998 Transcript_70212/m.195998 type:complete len:349 (-) Transcript_70212:150-1196(-)
MSHTKQAGVSKSCRAIWEESMSPTSEEMRGSCLSMACDIPNPTSSRTASPIFSKSRGSPLGFERARKERTSRPSAPFRGNSTSLARSPSNSSTLLFTISICRPARAHTQAAWRFAKRIRSEERPEHSLLTRFTKSLAFSMQPDDFRISTISMSMRWASTHSGVDMGATSSTSAARPESRRSRGGASRASARLVSRPWSSLLGISRETTPAASGSACCSSWSTSFTRLAERDCSSRTRATKSFLYGSRGSNGGRPGPFVATSRPRDIPFRSVCGTGCFVSESNTSLSRFEIPPAQASRTSLMACHTTFRRSREACVCLSWAVVPSADVGEALSSTPKQCSESRPIQMAG